MANIRKKGREFTQDYLKMQHGAMRWLARNGITYEEIREFRFRNIDETEHVVMVKRPVYSVIYDRATKIIMEKTSNEKFIKISTRGTEHDYFFMKSKFKSVFLFTREKPASWRTNIAVESLYSLFEIERICGKVDKIEGTDALTLADFLDNIELSKLNITKLENNTTKDLDAIREAEKLFALD